MAYSTRTVGIIAASTISVVLIGTAYALSGPLPFSTKIADAQSTHDLLVSYAAKDSDNDGLPDWEEALYGTDPNNPHSVNASVTDGQAVAQGLVKPKFSSATTTPTNINTVPGTSAADNTLTAQFSQQLFQQYMSTRGTTPPTQDDIVKFVETGVKQLETSQSIPDTYNLGQVQVSGSGPEALKAYAAAVEASFARHQVTEEQSELGYLSDGIQKNDPAALKKVAEIGKYYTSVSQDLMKLSVPKEVAASHLQAANAMAHLGQVITDLSVYKLDPLKTMVALGVYPDYVNTLFQAMTNMYASYTTEGVSIEKGIPGSHFYATLRLTESASSTSP